MADMWAAIKTFLSQHIFTLENGLAILLCLMLILIIILTSDTSPQWIYQGF